MQEVGTSDTEAGRQSRRHTRVAGGDGNERAHALRQRRGHAPGQRAAPVVPHQAEPAQAGHDHRHRLYFLARMSIGAYAGMILCNSRYLDAACIAVF